jgi:predicted porin
MKKSLLAVAAMTAFAGAAQAQSSVTVYGILDLGYQGGNTSVTNTNPGATATVNYPATTSALGTMSNQQVKTTQSVLGQGAEQTSRLGFKGSENLGGGTSAFFTAEFGLTPADQTLSGNTAAGLKNRQTFVGLKKNGLGDFAVGTQYTPIFNAVVKTDPGQLNNMVGSVIYTGQSDSSLAGGASGGNTNAFTTRVSNALTLNSEVLAGFQAHAIAILNNTNSTAVDTTATSNIIGTGGNVNTNGWGLGADYTWNKFFITANYQALKQNTNAINTIQPTALTVGGGTSGAAGGTPAVFNASAAVCNGTAGSCPVNVQDNQGYVGATYDFGILKAYASWIQRKVSDTQNTGIYQKRSAEQIGVRSFITPTIEGWASAGVGTFTPMGLNQNSAHFNAWQLGSNYWLSKRTNLYAIYGQYAQSNATYSVYNSSGVASTPYNTSVNANTYAVGVRHTF